MSQEIYERLSVMLNNIITIQSMDVPQYQKDESIRIMDKTLGFVLKELDQTTIDRLVYQEFKKRRMNSLE